jgi:hypothetical protein
MPCATKKLVHRSPPKRRRKQARASRADRRLARALDLALELEEPLNHATCLVRVLEQMSGDGDPETEAVAFVATQARTRLDTVHEIWNKLLALAEQAA